MASLISGLACGCCDCCFFLLSDTWHHWDWSWEAMVTLSESQFSSSVLSDSLWAAAWQASLSITNSWSLLKFMSIKSVMPSNHLILCQSLLLLPSIFPSIRVFSIESVLSIRWLNIGISASVLVLPMNIQDWFPLGLTGLISLQSKSQESSPPPQSKSINSLALSFHYGPTLTCIHWLLEKAKLWLDGPLWVIMNAKIWGKRSEMFALYGYRSC